jgi:indolepyruvate decarboxylase
MPSADKTTIGGYLAARLAQAGIRHYFAIPGDYNLALFDRMLENTDLSMIGCCNELNAGYAADGYARANGAAAMLVTYSVGGLSAINAVAGQYAEDLPVVVISGGVNTNSEQENQILHHTLGEVRYDYVREMFKPITVAVENIRFVEDAPAQIDRAISACLTYKKPVYIEIACNLAGQEVPVPKPLKLISGRGSDQTSLEEASNHAASMLNNALKPVVVGGPKLRSSEAVKPFVKLLDASGYAAAIMPNAKGFFPETHPGFIGIYWGSVSSPGVAAVVESADVYLYAGPVFSDYTTCGHTMNISSAKLIQAGPDFVRLPGAVYHGVLLADFLEALAGKVKYNKTSLDTFRRVHMETVPEPPVNHGASSSTRRLFAQIQRMLDSSTTIIAETGDSWFNALNLKLPEGSSFEIQMQYGSIGWSVGAALGYQAACPDRRVILCIGDGSFQMTAQEVSTMIRYGLKPIIFLINNGGYTIEVEIHDGPYNVINNWNYADLIKVFNGSGGNGWGCRTTTEGQTEEAIKKALDHDGLSLIEVVIDKDDCSRNLLEWGARVAANNSSPPKPTAGFH